ncbi:TetR/AcrR family transcriptional regulator [Parasphingorhabdus sp.]|uniref:TetR/AcrR family transcriptional regulator n=1 Tax=Parasphingorhabdus sp. TaxID=2709688 RepID=UPI003BB03D86
MKTRDRIVMEARRLYNRNGYGNVSSATLAYHLGISEGNLWYHFKAKRAILRAISEKFAQDIEKRLSRAPTGEADIVDEYTALLQAIIDELHEYRFLYRDQADYGEHDEIVQQGVRGWTERTHRQFQTYLAGFVAAGLLDWPKDRLADLAINVTIILRYGLEYFREMGDPIQEGGGAIRNTLLRHLTLFEYRLLPETVLRLRRFIDRMEVESEAMGKTIGKVLE